MPSPPIQMLMRIAPLSEAAAERLDGITRYAAMRRDEELLAIGRVSESIHFIGKGLARVYYLHKGEDVTDYFAMDGQFIGAVPSLFSGQPSKKGIHLLEDAEVHSINYKAFESLCTQYHEIEHVGRKLAIIAFLTDQQRIESIRFHSARERYAELEALYPGISNRAPLRHIASYLNITPVSLSRIRAGQQ